MFVDWRERNHKLYGSFCLIFGWNCSEEKKTFTMTTDKKWWQLFIWPYSLKGHVKITIFCTRKIHILVFIWVSINQLFLKFVSILKFLYIILYHMSEFTISHEVNNPEKISVIINKDYIHRLKLTINLETILDFNKSNFKRRHSDYSWGQGFLQKIWT